MNKIAIGVGIVVCVSLFGWASSMDYEQAMLDQAVYVQFVCEGTYPDYKNLEPECDND
jgi:hypothetical protein